MGYGGLTTGAKMLVGSNADGAATAAAELLGTLRGLAAKAGQIASYVDGFVPEEHRASFDKALSTLRANAPTSAPAAIRARIEDELKAPISALFATFEEEPFASASIGQVHRATLADGTAVAVKVQHPGIDRAVLADLDNAGMLESMLGNLGGRKFGSQEAVAEVRARFLEELDYRLEAARQERFAALFPGDEKIRIPRIVHERSSTRVLTSVLHHGVELDVAAQRSEPERRAYAETLWRFVFGGNLVGGIFNADPHPGNYLFGDDGEVTFLDFGCVIELPNLAVARAMHRAAIDRDEPAFRAGVRALLGTKPGGYEDWAVDFSRRCFEPIFASPFRVDRAYNVALVESMRGMRREILFKKGMNFVPLPPGMLFMNRLQFGFYSVLGRLDTTVDYAAIEHQLLSTVA